MRSVFVLCRAGALTRQQSCQKRGLSCQHRWAGRCGGDLFVAAHGVAAHTNRVEASSLRLGLFEIGFFGLIASFFIVGSNDHLGALATH